MKGILRLFVAQEVDVHLPYALFSGHLTMRHTKDGDIFILVTPDEYVYLNPDMVTAVAKKKD